MKTWRQLEAMAKRQGLTLTCGNRSWNLSEDDESYIARCEWWASGPTKTSRILRVMCEAALAEMGRKR
jgi:hypothetical protein